MGRDEPRLGVRDRGGIDEIDLTRFRGVALFLTCDSLRIDKCTSLLLDSLHTEIRRCYGKGSIQVVVGAWNFACIPTQQRLIACWMARLSLRVSRPGFFGVRSGRTRRGGNLK